jgi:CheY-like chemotaxis protein
MDSKHEAIKGERSTVQRVLLVEDNPVNQELFSEYLKILGVEVVVVPSADRAVAELTKAMRSNGFGLVLMDLHMPKKDGVQATIEWREIEDKEGLKPTPIYAITADVRTEERGRCMDSGMNGFLSKPFRLRDLERLLKSVIDF